MMYDTYRAMCLIFLCRCLIGACMSFVHIDPRRQVVVSDEIASALTVHVHKINNLGRCFSQYNRELRTLVEQWEREYKLCLDGALESQKNIEKSMRHVLESRLPKLTTSLHRESHSSPTVSRVASLTSAASATHASCTQIAVRAAPASNAFPSPNPAVASFTMPHTQGAKTTNNPNKNWLRTIFSCFASNDTFKG